MTARPTRPPLARLATLTLALALLGACNQRTAEPESAMAASGGQVKPVAANSVTHYAAARFADQVSFGATPALVAEIERLGFSAWIDAQFALPPSYIALDSIRIYNNQIPADAMRVNNYATEQLYKSFVTVPDQLRRRVAWSLSQFVTVSMNKVEQYGGLAYSNFLQDHAFGTYPALIHDVSINPPMGSFLDNIQNRPTTDACPLCAPNENYARELMQLFTLGVVKLNLDGSVQRDVHGKPLETYSQQDVKELARVLTGWENSINVPQNDHSFFDGTMVVAAWDQAHDRGAKTVLGMTFAAGREADVELDQLVGLLMDHPNVAPFVSLRLIQHLVTSNPSPAYLSRVARVFLDNGQGVKGDMKAVIKAILLDPEARRGDQAGASPVGFGKMREPLLWYTSVLRGLACSTDLRWGPLSSDGFAGPSSQNPFGASSVFSFYMPSDRAPGSNLLAPEQRLLNASEFITRFGMYRLGEPAMSSAAGCQVAPFSSALDSSPTAFVNLISERFFRGAMPVVLRQNLLDLIPITYGDTPQRRAMTLLGYALASPYYGAIR